jgi:hypothetical protein
MILDFITWRILGEQYSSAPHFRNFLHSHVIMLKYSPQHPILKPPSSYVPQC